MYHDVRPHERAGLARQLRYIRNFAEFVSIDDALALSRRPEGPDGRYVCVTFDDGFANCYTNATPILEEFDVPATFFVIPGYIEGRPPSMRRYARNRSIDDMAYLTWDQCRDMVARGMTIGSHTFSHASLLGLTVDEANDELRRSAEIITDRVGVPCRHFSAPWGQPEIDFCPRRDPELVRAAGYECLLTTVRGIASAAVSPFLMPRERLEPGWGDYHLRFFLS